jgi:hypothetical protein
VSIVVSIDPERSRASAASNPDRSRGMSLSTGMASVFVSYVGRLISVRSVVQLYPGPLIPTCCLAFTSVIARLLRFSRRGRRRVLQAHHRLGLVPEFAGHSVGRHGSALVERLQAAIRRSLWPSTWTACGCPQRSMQGHMHGW